MLRFPVGNFLVSAVLVYVSNILICCGLLWFWVRVVPCNSLRNELHKRGMCRNAFYPWWSAQKFSWGRTGVCWKFPQSPDTQSSFWTPAVSQYICTFVVFVLYLLVSSSNNLCFHLSRCVTPVLLNRQRPLLQNGDVALVHDSRTELWCCCSNYL
jgi:hypothetical protein